LLLVGLSVGCGSAEPTDVRVDAPEGVLSSAIYSGARDEDAASSVVALKVPGKGSTFELCTGALVAESIVLTARHCVSRALATSVSCTQDGQSTNGDHVSGDLEPQSIQVYTGSSPSFSGSPSAHGKQIFRPGGAILCNADIALLVLDRPIAGVAPLAVRLETGPRKGEAIRSVGYGQNDNKMPTGTRLRKDNVGVLAVGRTVSASKTPLGSREFEVGISICQGDSGGPAISEASGAVVGVVSRGGDCSDDYGHIYTTTAGFRDVFEAAFRAVGVSPNEEPRQPGAVAPTAAPTESENPMAEVATAKSGCSAASATPRGGVFGLFAALAALAYRRRRG
jgi:MYXO-CTERM domain-containing protein